MRLSTKQDYRRMLQKPIKFVGKLICADIKFNNEPSSRLGLVVTKQYGDAPERNRFKRCAREAFRLGFPSFSKSFDIVVRPRQMAKKASMQQISQELVEFIGKAHQGQRI